jgi:hypothetical protein
VTVKRLVALSRICILQSVSRDLVRGRSRFRAITLMMVATSGILAPNVERRRRCGPHAVLC